MEVACIVAYLICSAITKLHIGGKGFDAKLLVRPSVKLNDRMQHDVPEV